MTTFVCLWFVTRWRYISHSVGGHLPPTTFDIIKLICIEKRWKVVQLKFEFSLGECLAVSSCPFGFLGNVSLCCSNLSICYRSNYCDQCRNHSVEFLQNLQLWNHGNHSLFLVRSIYQSIHLSIHPSIYRGANKLTKVSFWSLFCVGRAPLNSFLPSSNHLWAEF